MPDDGVFICYAPKKFRSAALAVIRTARQICADYKAQGFDLTLRQLYYQFVARAIIPNRQSEYKRLGSIVNDGRLAGLLDWTSIVDRTRNKRGLLHIDDPATHIERAVNRYHNDKWADQPERVEVWIEKDALVGVLESVCPNLDVDFFSCRGYVSQSEIWGAAQRLGQYLANGQNVIVLHLGDHDPSGLDMTRDINSRLQMFVKEDEKRYLAELMFAAIDDGTLPPRPDGYGDETDEAATEWKKTALAFLAPREWAKLTVERIGLNRDQIDLYGPPPNPAKESDSRWADYVAITGLTDSWELDALDPATLGGIITDAVEGHRDHDLWLAAWEREDTDRDLLRRVADNWEEIVDWLGNEAA